MTVTPCGCNRTGVMPTGCLSITSLPAPGDGSFQVAGVCGGVTDTALRPSIFHGGNPPPPPNTLGSSWSPAYWPDHSFPGLDWLKRQPPRCPWNQMLENAAACLNSWEIKKQKHTHPLASLQPLRSDSKSTKELFFAWMFHDRVNLTMCLGLKLPIPTWNFQLANLTRHQISPYVYLSQLSFYCLILSY